MQTVATDVLVIGGGATGVGCLRDLAIRGMRAILVEKGDLTHGTTGRYHGLLHSGGRYVVKDPQSATECARENAILRRIMPHCLEDSGGFFVTTPWDDPDYADRFLAACHATGVAAQEIPVAEALYREPALNPRLSRVIEVADGAADSFLAAHANVASAREYGASALTYHHVVELLHVDDRVVGALVEDLRSGELKRIEAAWTINAAGAWAGRVAALAGVTVTVTAGKGTMVAMNHRMVNTVINRCKMPSDGDIIVPIRTVAVIGTTDTPVPNPDVYAIEPEEITFMLEEGAKLIPGFASYRALRAWAGVRPLYQEEPRLADGLRDAENRDISRAYKLLDHERRDGVSGLISIVGGKWTTYRLMAQETVDRVAQRLGNNRPCRTHAEMLPPPADEKPPTGGDASRFFWLGKPLADVERAADYGDLICECELVTREQVQAAIDGGAANLDDIRRDVRVGMGPCQGGWCIYRTTALLFERIANAHDGDATRFAAAIRNSNAALLHFLQERWKGVQPVLWGDQLRQARLDELIYVGVLGVQRLGDLAESGDAVVTDHPAIATERLE